MASHLLVLAHVGTSLGHLIRVGEILQTISTEWNEVYVAVPRYAVASAKRHGNTSVISRVSGS